MVSSVSSYRITGFDPQLDRLVYAPHIGANAPIGEAEEIAALIRDRHRPTAEADLGANAPEIHVAVGLAGEAGGEYQAVGAIGMVHNALCGTECAGADATAPVAGLDIGIEARQDAGDSRAVPEPERGFDRAACGAPVIVEYAVLLLGERPSVTLGAQEGEADIRQLQELRATANGDGRVAVGALAWSWAAAPAAATTIAAPKLGINRRITKLSMAPHAHRAESI